MRTVERKKWQDYFKTFGPESTVLFPVPIRLFRRGMAITYFSVNLHWFQPFILFHILVIVLFVGGIFSSFTLALAISLFLFSFYLKSRLAKVANNIFIRREDVPLKPIEYENIRVSFFIHNFSRFAADLILVEDFCDLALEGDVRTIAVGELAAGRSTRVSYDCLIDGGMGKRKIGPLTIRLKDIFGIFEYRISYHDEVPIEVLPKIEAVPPFTVVGSYHSNLYGIYEVSRRGLSVNFSGIRNFAPGDSLRHIAWKRSASLTASHNVFLVKEFEKAVNSDITLALNMNPLLHVGYKSASTWEICRDFGLSLVQQQMRWGNTIQVVTQNYCSPRGSGNDLFLELSKRIAAIDPTISPDEEGASPLLLRSRPHLLTQYFQWFVHGTTLFYVAPYHPDDFADSYPILCMLKDKKISITVVYVKTSQYVASLAEQGTTAKMVAAVNDLKAMNDDLLKLENADIRVVLLSRKTSLIDAVDFHWQKKKTRGGASGSI